MMPSESPEDQLSRDAPAPVSIPPGDVLPPGHALWGLRDLAFFFAFTLVAFVASNLLALSGYAALRPIMGWHIPPQGLQENPFFLVTLQSIFYGFLFGYVYLLVVVYHRRPLWTTLNWRNPTRRASVRFLLGGILLAFAVQLAPSLLPDAESFPLERLFSSPAGAYTVAAFAVLVAPFMEEFVFRGVLFSIFERLAGLRFSIIATALLFAGLHVPEYWGAWHHVLMILVVGIVFSMARGLTGSLVPSVILHLAYNATLMTGLYFETQHFRAVQGLLAP